MIMKLLFRYTSTIILRAALLFGAVAFVNTQTTAQTAEQLAAMPNAFQTVTPTIGDGQYYYIQFYYNGPLSYLTDRGLNKKAWASDFMPSNNRLWTLVSANDGDDTHFKLMSKDGNYLGWGAFEGSNRYGGVGNFNNAVTFTIRPEQDGYNIFDVTNSSLLSRYENNEWSDFPYQDDRQSHKNSALMHFVKLKDNVAYIIYYRGEGTDNDDSNANTTRHYLTYSGTTDNTNEYWRESTVSSRRSIIPSDKLFRTLPTLAAYHQDGLWTLEETGTDGEFYIKKYGTEEYLNAVNNGTDWFYWCDLGTKNEVYGKYVLEDPSVNRYTRIQNKKYQTSALAAGDFHTWNGDGAGASQTGNPSVDFYVGTSRNAGETVVGTGDVKYLTYADITNYSKMIIKGTQDVQLRVLMSRQQSDTGPWVEKNVTIGSDGMAVVDLSNLELNATTTGSATAKMTYVCGSDDAVNTSYGQVSQAVGGYNSVGTEVGLGNKDWGVNNLIYMQVDASSIPGRIAKVTLKAKVSGSTDNMRTTGWGVGYNSSDWSSSLTWNTADKSITKIGDEVWTETKSSTAFEDKEFDITQAFTGDADKIVTILVYELAAAGGNFKDAVVEVEYYPTVTFAHLNAIKLGWGSPSGTISSIELVNNNTEDATTPRYLNYGEGDGWQVFQWSGDHAKYWYAGFYPVEVPVPNKDEFFQVLVKWGANMINHEGKSVPCPTDEANYDLWQLEMVDDYLHFRLKAPNGGYLKPGGTGVTAPNDPTDAEILTNAKFFNETSNDFSLTWFYVNPADKEIVVDHMVTHKKSYLQQYAQAGLDKQGLATDADDDWWNYDKGIQKTNHFEITHYVKKGNTITVEFPTVLNRNNDHVYYQRFYNYDEPDESMDLANLKAHVSLDTSDDGNVQYFLYKNGMVTGQKLDWTGIDDGGYAHNALRRINFTNSDGTDFTVAADVSRYSDLTYENPSSPQTGDLEEPSLTMRYLFHMKDAKEIATQLTACTEGSDNWLEEKTIHFPAKQVAYESSKWVGYRGEFLGLRHVFSDYWVFDGNGTDDDNLVSAVNNASGGKIEVEISDPNTTGIRKGGYNQNIDLKGTTEGSDDDYQGFYFYDKMYNKNSYGDSRFIVFRYPASGAVTNTGKEAYVNVYLNNNGTKYQLAQFTVIFDADTETLPWKKINSSGDEVQGTLRDPNKLRERAGKPIAKVTFDYPLGKTYQTPSVGQTKQGWVVLEPNSTLANSSPVPLVFDNTNYAFNGFECNWGSYAITSQMTTNYGNQKKALPANAGTYGYNIDTDDGLQSGFLYIDASEQPGDICSVDFEGEFCAGDKLMCSGWISGSNKVGGADYRCPGSITLTVKGERTEGGVKVTDNIYRFCPGQCYELNDGTGVDGSTDGENVVWQQFYFEFNIYKKYERQWVEVNNNCVSSNGGDFMLDNIEIYAIVPEVDPEMNTPICVNNEGSEMQLLKLDVGFEKLMLASGVSEATDAASTHDYNFGMVFLKKDVFLKTFKTSLSTHNGIDLTLEEVEANVNAGVYSDINGVYKDAYEEAFNAAMLGTKAIWDSNNPTANQGAGVLNFHWSNDFSKMESYSFAKAVNRLNTIFGYTDLETNERFLVMNGNFPKLNWEANTDYYLIPYNAGITDLTHLYEDFNICSDCSKEKVFQILPPIQILSMETSDVTQEVEVCEGKIPTVLTDLTAYNTEGVLVTLKDLNFDWWLGDLTADPKVLGTLSNYHSQTKTIGTETVRLDVALSTLRAYYPGVTSLDGLIERTTKTPNLTTEMIEYLQELVDAGQLILHQKSINIPAQKVSDEDPYCYFVACPIHDGYFDKALNNSKANNVAYFCDEPQGLRLKIGEKAPTLQCGFVPGENGFADYAYPAENPILSIRLAKKAQFETVQHGTVADEAIEDPMTAAAELHFLWLPIRDAKVESTGSTKVIQKSTDFNVYLASTDDPTWDQDIYTAMSATAPSLPIVGKIVVLNATNVAEETDRFSQTNNRLCIYFTKNFEVREGYTYTLSLPFREDGDGNACDGNILLNVKIVPDYEVWTGGAGNTDWNNDQNWRRADGNTANSGLNKDELYVGAAAADSPLKDYKTNAWNYRSAKDRIFRKGFAPLYCTHVLMESDEWGNAPQLYDALDGKTGLLGDNPEPVPMLLDSPFPNLRDTSTPILKFDMQARKYDLWSETYGSAADKGRTGDLLAEMYQVNSCDEIAFQPGTEVINAHLLNYNNAWVEYQLDMKRWYLLGSPLQGTIAGEWYAPSGTAQQKTTYYDPVTFGKGYDRYSPAIFQRSWDKAKAVLYEVGSTYSTGDNPDDLQLNNDGSLPGSTQQGRWSGADWTALANVTAADEYLDRLGYKPLSDGKVNVAMKGIWSNTYNDATVDYTKGGFSVMVLNNLKGNSNDNSAIIRLPKEDTMYDYYQYSQTGAADGGTDTELSDVQSVLNRAKNRGRLKTDNLLPVSTQIEESETTPTSLSTRYAGKYGYRTTTRVPTQIGDGKLPMTLRDFTESASAGISNMGYYLVENPFPCGMDMQAFFTANPNLERKYWLLTATGQHLVQQAKSGEWIVKNDGYLTWTDPYLAGDDDRELAVTPPGQGFFVQAKTAGGGTTITFNKDMQVQSRWGEKDGTGTTHTIVVGTKKKMTTKEETITLDNGTTQTVEIEVPETDADGNYIIEDFTEDVTVYNYKQTDNKSIQFPLMVRTRGEEASSLGLVISAERGDSQSSALVMQREEASNDFLPEEDTEVFITSDLEHVPTVYTLCGRLATTINSIHDFRCLPLGVESSSAAPCTLTFRGVEMLGDSISLYDAVEQKLMPLESGAKVVVSGQTQNRYYLVRGLNQKEAAEESHLQIFAKGLTASVIASTAEPITSVRCFDTAGRLIHSASPQNAEYSFSLPMAGVYIIDAETENDRKTVKLMVK